MEIVTYNQKNEKNFFYSKENFAPIFWRYLVMEKIKENISFKIVDSHLKYFISIDLDCLKRDTYFENLKSERYQQVLLEYWHYFIDELQKYNTRLFITGVFENFDEYEEVLLRKYSNNQISNMTYLDYQYSDIEKKIFDKFSRSERLDLTDIDITKILIGHVSSDNQCFYSVDHTKIIYKYKIKSADISLYSLIWIISLIFVLWKLGHLMVNRELFNRGTFIDFSKDLLLLLGTAVVALWLCIFIKDLFLFIYYSIKLKFLNLKE